MNERMIFAGSIHDGIQRLWFRCALGLMRQAIQMCVLMLVLGSSLMVSTGLAQDSTQTPIQASIEVPTSGDEISADSSATPVFTKFDALMAGISIFVLAVFVGFEMITKVPPTLHTPLMSGYNAISGITIVGALLVAGKEDYAAWLGVLAVVFAMINVIGGFWVTHRMLSMFKRK